ncbi:MAG: NfeD family protein [Hyphomicrobiales bacterium]
MSWLLIAFLIIFGIILLILEILVLPGHIIFGLIGFCLFGFGIFKSFDIYGTTAGIITALISVIVAIIALVLSLRSKTWNKLKLNAQITGKVNTESLDLKIGDRGSTIGRLAPSGKADFNGKLYEVRTNNLFLDPNTDIEVQKIDSNIIYVKPVSDKPKDI